MRIFATAMILIFSFQSLIKADDIRDFEIEGMSLGDSALLFFDQKTLEQNKEEDWFDDKSYLPIAELKLKNSEIYTSFQIHVKNNDSEYIMKSISGFIFYKNNIDECYKKLDSIVSDIENLFSDIKNFGKNNYKHNWDKSGKSTITDVVLEDSNGYQISVQCYDWSEDLPYWDSLRITIDTKEFNDWLIKAR